MPFFQAETLFATHAIILCICSLVESFFFKKVFSTQRLEIHVFVSEMCLYLRIIFDLDFQLCILCHILSVCQVELQTEIGSWKYFVDKC